MRKSRIYWTKEKIQEEALKYVYINEFVKNAGGAYYSACKFGWLNETCSHLIGFRKPNNYWNKERCKEEALKYSTRNEFQKKCRGAYTAARINFWLDEICCNMQPKGDLRKRYIYSLEFSDNCVYVGLTYDVEIRKKIHLGLCKTTKQSEKSAVYQHIVNTGLTPKIIILTKKPINENLAQKKELYYIEKYKKEKWIILNKIKGGALGYGVKKWTKEKIVEEALKYNKRSEFKKNSGAYQAALTSKIINEVCSHMNTPQRTQWSKELAHYEALKYENNVDFYKFSKNAYVVARKYGWLDDIRTHMKITIKNNKNGI